MGKRVFSIVESGRYRGWPARRGIVPRRKSLDGLIAFARCFLQRWNVQKFYMSPHIFEHSRCRVADLTRHDFTRNGSGKRSILKRVA